MSNIFNEKVNLTTIFKQLSNVVESKVDVFISAISDSDNVIENSICDYVRGPLPEKKQGLVLLVKEELSGYLCVVVKDPQEVITEIIKYINQTIGFKRNYLNAEIPSSVKVGENVVIEENVEIGEGTIIEHNAVIHSGTKIGKNCLIRTHASIGGDGYGYFRNRDGVLIKQPHLGGVELADNVEIGSNTCIVRGIVNDTYLGFNVKVDNLVHIAHDCYIDDDTYIIACVELSGYVRIGKRSRIAPKSCVKQRVIIGDDVVVGMGAVVLKNIPSNTVVIGNPAKPLRVLGKK